MPRQRWRRRARGSKDAPGAKVANKSLLLDLLGLSDDNPDDHEDPYGGYRSDRRRNGVPMYGHSEERP